MIRNKLLMAVATAALIAGTTGAFAQQENRNAPAEKSAPSVSHPGGAAQQNRNEPKAGQSGRSETTGQAQNRSNAQENRNNPATQENKAGQGDKQTGQANERSNRGDRERSRTGQSNERPNRNEASQHKENAPDRTNRGDREPSTTGQGATERNRNQGPTTGQNPNSNPPAERDRVQGERNENRTTEGRTTTEGSVNLSSEQRTRIHEVVVSERNAPRVSRVDFDLKVGTAIPRSVKLGRVPVRIIEIEPRWRGFEYFMVGDEIVIVDPRRMEIVAVVPA